MFDQFFQIIQSLTYLIVNTIINHFFKIKKTYLQKTYAKRIAARKIIYFVLFFKSNFFFFFSFRPFPLVRGGHSVSSFSTFFCLRCPSPSHQLPLYLLLLHLKIFSLVSLFSSFLVTP